MSIVRNRALNFHTTHHQVRLFCAFRNKAVATERVNDLTQRKPHLRKPKEPDYRKKLLLSLIEPFYPKDRRPESEKCKEWKASRNYTPHPYVSILSKECSTAINSPFVYLLHVNPSSKLAHDDLRKQFLKRDVHLHDYSYEVIKLSIENTRFSNLLPIFRYHGCFASSNSEKFKDVVALCKSNQQRLVLLGGIYDNRILSLNQIQEYINHGSLDAVRAQLCNLLSVQSSQLSSSLSHHTRELAFNLTNLSQEATEKTMNKPITTHTSKDLDSENKSGS